MCAVQHWAGADCGPSWWSKHQEVTAMISCAGRSSWSLEKHTLDANIFLVQILKRDFYSSPNEVSRSSASTTSCFSAFLKKSSYDHSGRPQRFLETISRNPPLLCRAYCPDFQMHKTMRCASSINLVGFLAFFCHQPCHSEVALLKIL